MILRMRGEGTAASDEGNVGRRRREREVLDRVDVGGKLAAEGSEGREMGSVESGEVREGKRGNERSLLVVSVETVGTRERDLRAPTRDTFTERR